MSVNEVKVDRFINKAKEIYGDQYDYSEVQYKRMRYPVKIICKDHGPFSKNPSLHIRGSGCPTCLKLKN